MKRRVPVNILSAAGVLGCLLFLAACIIWNGYLPQVPAQPEKQNEASAELFALDTYIRLTAYGADAEEALKGASDEIRKMERLLSVTDPDSDIYAVNHSGGGPVAVSRETEEILSFALQMAEETEGALEPTIYPVLTAWGFTTDENRIPADDEIHSLLEHVGYHRVQMEEGSVSLEDGMMLDLGSVGKGYIGDMAVQILKEHGITSALLDIGGNIQTVGQKGDGNDWQLGIRDPFSDGRLGILSVNDQAVVTSGNYERYFIGEDGKRYGHIVDSAAGYPVENGMASVTIIAKEGRFCDALSTALFVMGASRAVDYWRQHQDFDMILVTEDQEILLTKGAADAFQLGEDYSDWKIQMIQESNNALDMEEELQ